MLRNLPLFRHFSQSPYYAGKECKCSSKDKCILHVNPGACVECYKRDMLNMGFSKVRYLKHLRVLLGECDNITISKQATRHPGTEYVEEDLKIRIQEPYNSPSFNIHGKAASWGLGAIKAPQAWSISRGEGVNIAVIDTGVCKEHPALRCNYKGGINVLSPEAEPEDYNGHGTHVASTIAGCAHELGIIGVAPKSNVFGVKTFDRNGSAKLSNLLTAIDWCIKKRMKIINMSFGMERPSATLKAAVEELVNQGIIMIAASGNQGWSDKIDYPSKYEETIGVCSVSRNNNFSKFNNMGEGVDIAAPGERIVSASLNQTVKEMSGTSMAVPHVVGVTAMLLEKDPTLTVSDVKRILIESTDKHKQLDGLGVLNAYNALKYYASSS